MPAHWFGLSVCAPDGLQPLLEPSGGPSDVEILTVEPRTLAPAADSARPLWSATIDGQPFRANVVADGAVRFTWGTDARFELSADRGTLRCEPADARHPGWQRVLLDSVMQTVALLAGFEALHASAVSYGASAVAIVTANGGGKTTLAVELLNRGARFLCDDVLALARGDGRTILGHPGPPVLNLAHAQHAHAPVGHRVLGRFDAEEWLQVTARLVTGGPATVRDVILLDRAAGGEASLQRVSPNPLALLPHALRCDGSPLRQRLRLALYSDLASTANLWRLSATEDTAVGALANLVEHAIGHRDTLAS